LILPGGQTGHFAHNISQLPADAESLFSPLRFVVRVDLNKE